MTKKILHKIKIEEISFVDRPAQKAAKMTIMKRQKENDEMTKEEAEALTKSLEDLKKQFEESEAKVAKAEADLKTSQAIAKMSDEEKTFVAKMSDKDKEAFMDMKDEDKKKKMKDVKKVDETLSLDGSEIRKSEVGDAQFAIFKRLIDKQASDEKRIAKAEKATAFAKFEKRASDDFKNLPGELAKALEGIATLDEEIIKTIEAIFKSANDMNTEAFKTIGKQTGDIENTPKGKIEKFADDIMKRDSISKAAAIAKAWEENPKLYDETQEAA